jgi:hypothetical protein
MGFAQSLQVKQYVAEVRGRFAWFRVFETGDSRFYLFDMFDPAGCSTTIQFPVRKADLQPDVRRALRHGAGHPR